MTADPADAVREYLARAPSDGAWARDAVAPFATLTPEERLRALAALCAAVETLRGDRPLATEDGELPFWRHWMDPGLARRR